MFARQSFAQRCAAGRGSLPVAVPCALFFPLSALNRPVIPVFSLSHGPGAGDETGESHAGPT